MLTLPADGMHIRDFQEVNRALLLSGASIQKINCVRKHMTALSGGRLAKTVNGARIFSLIISDVPDDDLSVIPSGPKVGKLQPSKMLVLS